MQEVSGVLNDKQFDYLELKGDTGPLVYPAGFVWIFAALYYVTDQGTKIQVAQYIFSALYIAMIFVVFAIYRKANAVRIFTFHFTLSS
jgi:alpha-1,3-mannosyltransferase